MSACITAQGKSEKTLLDCYASLLSSVEQMHELANCEQWVELIEQRTNYVLQVEKLRELDAVVELDADGQQRKAELLEKILEHDVDIRRRLVARRDELGKLIEVTQRQRDLHRAYAPQQGSAVTMAPDDVGSTRSE